MTIPTVADIDASRALAAEIDYNDSATVCPTNTCTARATAATAGPSNCADREAPHE